MISMRSLKSNRPAIILAAVSLLFWISFIFLMVRTTIRPRKPLLGSALVYWIMIVAMIAVVTQWKSHRRQILLLLAATLISLGLMEIGLRLIVPEASLLAYTGLSSTKYHHMIPPGKKMFSGYVGLDPVTVRSNEDGFRTPYSREEFLKYKYRIALLGDSFTFGINVKEDLIMARQLETLLRERLKTDDLAVLNTGTISYSPFLERLRFDGVIKDYKPTLTLLYLDVTDVGDDQAYMGEFHESNEIKKPVRAGAHGGSLLWRGAQTSADSCPPEAVKAPV
ncbi:SGNH/GDSL hydrolase family protein [Candidatus Sumerlaeota bacterium]|nr:SGNH/GDSL hydrolase family protein [Candidatus Sumerlaeota bacterium]